MRLAVNNSNCIDTIAHSIKVVLSRPCGMQGTKLTYLAHKFSRFIFDDVGFCYCLMLLL